MNTSVHLIRSILEIETGKYDWVYDIEMYDTPHNFFANDILVHNSLFIQLNDDDDSFLQNAMDLYIIKYRLDVALKYNNGLLNLYFIMLLLHLKTLSHLYLGDKKKRYYGIMKNGKKYIHGINIIRKDCPLVLRSSLNTMMEQIVRLEFTLQSLLLVKLMILTQPYKNIAIFKRFGMPFLAYVKNIPQTLKSSLWANELFDLNINHTDVVLMFYVNDLIHLKKKDKHTAICLRLDDIHLIDLNKDKFTIDYTTYFQKQVIKPLELFRTDQNLKILSLYRALHPLFYSKTAPAGIKCPKCLRTHSKLLLAKRCIRKVDRLNKELVNDCIKYLLSFSY